MPDLRVEPDDLTQVSQITETDKAIAPRFWQKWGNSLIRRALGATS